MKCPNCNYENDSNRKFCEKCGLDISFFERQKKMQKNAPEENNEKGIITCPKCGRNVFGTLESCPECRYPINSFYKMIQIQSTCMAKKEEHYRMMNKQMMERISKEQSELQKKTKKYAVIAIIHVIALIACIVMLINGFDLFLVFPAFYCLVAVFLAVANLRLYLKKGMLVYPEVRVDSTIGLYSNHPQHGQSIAEYNRSLFDWFYNDLRNDQLPTIPSPTQAEIMEYRREREARLSRISAPATEEKWYDPEKIKANESIPIEIVIWVDKVYNYYFESLRRQFGVIHWCDGARASLYRHKGYHYYTVSETHPHVYVD